MQSMNPMPSSTITLCPSLDGYMGFEGGTQASALVTSCTCTWGPSCWPHSSLTPKPPSSHLVKCQESPAFPPLPQMEGHHKTQGSLGTAPQGLGTAPKPAYFPRGLQQIHTHLYIY